MILEELWKDEPCRRSGAVIEGTVRLPVDLSPAGGLPIYNQFVSSSFVSCCPCIVAIVQEHGQPGHRWGGRPLFLLFLLLHVCILLGRCIPGLHRVHPQLAHVSLQGLPGPPPRHPRDRGQQDGRRRLGRPDCRRAEAEGAVLRVTTGWSSDGSARLCCWWYLLACCLCLTFSITLLCNTHFHTLFHTLFHTFFHTHFHTHFHTLFHTLCDTLPVATPHIYHTLCSTPPAGSSGWRSPPSSGSTRWPTTREW